jgi:hypothetical protein
MRNATNKVWILSEEQFIEQVSNTASINAKAFKHQKLTDLFSNELVPAGFRLNAAGC